MTNAARKQQAGFTLLELMITVAVVAILSSIAYASYQDYVVRTRRAAAASCLQERAQLLERFYTTNMTYVGATVSACEPAVAAHYNTPSFSAGPAANTYTLQIVPIANGVQARKDTKCGTLSIASTGVRGASGTSSSTPQDCW